MKAYAIYKASTHGFVGDVPQHWVENTIKHGFEITLGKMLQSDRKQPTEVCAPYLRSANVQWGLVDIGDVQQMWFSPEEVCQLSLAPGDLVACEGGDAGRAAIWQGEIKECFFQNSVNRVRSAGGNSTAFLMYWLASLKAGGYVDIVCNKATIAHLTKEKLSNLPMVFPSIDEQLAIATYLDAETKRIDGLIEEKKVLVSLLLGFRGGVVRERTSGIDLRSQMRSTGNEFMPEIPANWGFVPVRRYARITNGSTPLKDNAAFWAGGTFPWLNSAVVNQDEVTEGSELVTEEALRLCHLPVVSAGSVLIALTGQGKTRGQATVLRIQATINQHLAAIVCDPERLDGEFLFWTLTGQYEALRMVSDGQGGTKGALSCDELGRFQIPMPPLALQREIAQTLYDETRKIDDLVTHVANEIDLLQEMRSSTITDAVMGRIDVRTRVTN